MSEREQSPQDMDLVTGARTPAGSGAHGYAAPDESSYTAPQYSTSPVTLRRPDGVAALLLILAGIAAGISLLMQWVRDNERTGWDLLLRGLEDLERSLGEVFRSGFWQPLAVILGGGVLFLLGLLMIVPARTHRFLGVLALLVSLTAGAGVLVPFARAGWDPSVFDAGLWTGVAVAALGLLGALKAMLTGPRYGTLAPQE